MHTMIRLAIGAATLTCATALAGCGGSSSSIQPPVHLSSTTPSPGSSSTPSSSATSTTSAPTSWTMPDMRGKNLQEAQDAIQDLTGNRFRHSESKDLTGKDRHQFLDHDWQVCTSTPAAGETFTADTEIEFGVVRVDSETCPS